jgi:chromosome condensin MukBEF complex kleisin-like MukF subunit
MTIQKGKDLLEQSNPSVNEVQKCLNALTWDRQYVQNSITLGIRDKESGQENIDEISDLIEKLQKKLECITS